MFYVELNDKIVLYDENYDAVRNAVKHSLQYQDLPIKETDRPIVDFEFADTEEYKEKQRQKEEQEFNRKFFHTSLGYVSRDVHMKNGVVKDFLTDILPLLKVGIPVLVYTRELVQSKVPATQQFIDECGQQLIADFYGNQD